MEYNREEPEGVCWQKGREGENSQAREWGS